MKRSLSGSRPSMWSLIATLLILFAVPVVYGKSDKKSQSNKNERSIVFEEEFALERDGKLVVEVDDMDVILETNDGRTASVAVYVSGRDRDKARGYFEKIRFEAQLLGRTLEVRSRDNNQYGWDTWFGSRHPHVWVVVMLPRQIDVEIETEDGDIKMDGVNGNAYVRTEDGDIVADAIDGDSIEIRSEDGDIVAKSLTGRDLTLWTEDGDIEVDAVNAQELDVSVEDGDIVLSRVDSKLTIVKTDDGDLDVVISGARLEISCADGNIHARLLDAMEVEIEIEDGDVVLDLPKNTGFDLDLGGGDVNIRTKLEIEGRVSDDSLRGSVNDGGPVVRVRGGDGSIVVREK